MHVTRLQIICIVLYASLTLSCSIHISFDVEDIKQRINTHEISQNEKCGGVCMTPGCIQAAARILSSMDESVDPCDNFYQFTCGNWLRSNAIPEDKNSRGLFAEVRDEVQLKLQNMIEKELDGTEPAFVKMLKDFYDACMDLETIDKLGSEPLKKDLASLGAWPVVEGGQWNESTFDWVDTVIAFRRFGYVFDMLIDLYLVVDEQNSTTNVIFIDRPYFRGMNLKSLINGLNDSETADHFKLMVKEAVLLGADQNTTERELLEVLEFEIELAKIIMSEEEEKDDNAISTEFTPSELKKIILEEKEEEEILNISRKRRERRDVSRTSSRYTVAELQKIVPEIPWLKFINGLLNDEIGEDENILVPDPVFFKKLGPLLEKTEKRVVANYMFWKMVNSAKYFLSKEWREIGLKHKDKPESRQEICFQTLGNELNIALNSYYVRLYFKEDSKNAVMELIKYIHRELLRIIEGSDWMDDVTKKEAMEKANSMKTYIGYRNELLNDSAIMEIYENLKISNNSYYKNVINIKKWRVDNKFSTLKKPKIKAEWTSYLYSNAAMVNAFYDPRANTIGFPAGILQNAFFDKDRPHYMNFAAIGYIIGHEITHGFDVNGKKYDKDGNKVEWWDKTTDELYHKRVQCMIDQYSNYTLESGIKVNGELTQAENIADNGGLKEAYRAYHTWVKDHGTEPLLPGLKYTQSQLFWISAANAWCMKVKPEFLEKLLMYDPHSPAEFRVIGPMSNLHEFSEDFSCAPDSPMNRENKCHVW